LGHGAIVVGLQGGRTYQVGGVIRGCV
jgi:hypothetical protein